MTLPKDLLRGPISLGGKLITRAQVGGMVERLAARGISTEGMTPSQIVRKCWAEELKAAGKATEGRMLDEMVEQETKGAKEEATLEAEIGKDPASGGKKVEATPPVEAGWWARRRIARGSAWKRCLALRVGGAA